MQRYEKARSYVYSRYSKIYNDTIHERAFTHTSSVDNFMTLLAISRSLPIEIAKIAALFHDYATFAHNCPSKDHARLSSLHAYHYLSETQEFSTNEIDEICYAIAQHSKNLNSAMIHWLKHSRMQTSLQSLLKNRIPNLIPFVLNVC